MEGAAEEENFGAQNIGYQQLEMQFQQVLRELANDQNLERFRVEYERIHSALKKSHEQEKMLLTKCRQLSKDILGGAGKVQIALKMSNDDMQTITYLRTELQKTYKYLDISKEHQESSKNKIQELNHSVKNLTRQLEENETLSEGQVANVQECLAAIEELKKEKEVLETSISSNSQDLEQTLRRVNQLGSDIQKLKSEIEDLTKRKKDEEERVKGQQEEKKVKKNELDNIKKVLDTINVQKQEAKNEVETNMKVVRQREETENQAIAARDKEKKLEALSRKEEAIELKKKEDLSETVMLLHQKLAEKKQEKQKFDAEYKSLLTKDQSLSRERARIEREKEELIKKQKEAEELGEKINFASNELESEIDLQKKSASRDESVLQKIRRNMDVVQTQIEQAELNNKKLKEDLQAKDKLLKEKDNYSNAQRQEQDRLNKAINALTAEVKKYNMQATEAKAKFRFAKDEVKQRQIFIEEVKGINQEIQEKLKKQQNLYEAVRSDRNVVSKKLAEKQEEKHELGRKYKMVIYQITQLKEEIDTKQNEYVKENTESKKKVKILDETQKAIKKIESEIRQKCAVIADLDDKIKSLYAMIKDSETRRQKLQDDYKMVVAERDILGTQLIRRNAEASLLYEKIKISQSTLAKGEAQYNERLAEIDSKQAEIKRLSVQIANFERESGAIVNFKNEIHNLSKELIEERLKVKALSEELQSPMNVHRWRKLEATDNITFEQMTKIQSLQRKLIEKTEEVRKKEAEVVHKDNELKKIQTMMKRLPAVEEQKMIEVYEDNLRQKALQLSSMGEEYKHSAQRLYEQSLENDRLKKELTKFKKKYFDQKKREQQKREEGETKSTAIKIHLPEKRFTGGGFNLS